MKVDKLSKILGQNLYKIHTGKFYKGKEKCAIVLGDDERDKFLDKPRIITDNRLEHFILKFKK